MLEQSKAAKRRFFDGKFHSRYFVGHGIDIGAGNDCLENNMKQFMGIKSIRNWDMKDGDAQYLNSIANEQYDFAHSSHCLEHMENPVIAIDNWLRIIRPGGYLIVTVPDQHMYEHNFWPSRFNDDHKWTFTVTNINDVSGVTINVLEFLFNLRHVATVEKIEVINSFFDEMLTDNIDQTMFINPECCIEFILRKN